MQFSGGGYCILVLDVYGNRNFHFVFVQARKLLLPDMDVHISTNGSNAFYVNVDMVKWDTSI